MTDIMESDGLPLVAVFADVSCLGNGRAGDTPGFPALPDGLAPVGAPPALAVGDIVALMVTRNEALRLPSEHEYGNGVAIFTRDGDTARDFTSRVDVGMVGVNVPIPVPIAYYTFGGWKASGFGDLNQHGTDGLKFYTKTKTVTTRWPSGAKEGSSFVMPAGS